MGQSRFSATVTSVWQTLSGAAKRTDAALARIIADSMDGVIAIDAAGIVVASSRVARQLLSLGSDPVEGRRAADILPEAMLAVVQRVFEEGKLTGRTPLAVTVLKGDDGEDLVLQFAVTLSALESVEGQSEHLACLNFWDNTERRRSEERLAFLATHDQLTGALSRTGLVSAVNQRFQSEHRRTEGLTVLLIDLARFKPVNDALGHAHGDMLLKQVVSRLKGTGAELVARLGGHSFVVAHPGLLPEETGEFCELILGRMVEPYMLGPHRAIIGADIGVSHSRISGFDPELLFGHADMALTVARQMAGNGYTSFSPEMDERLRAKLDMEAALHQAIERGEISVMYQPQVALDSGEIIGVEALMRWMHPELGAVAPDRFIPVAEETGRIVELGRWVLEAACAEVASWPEKIRLSVNISPIQFDLVDVVAEVKGALQRSGLPPSRLDIEITEGIFMSNARAVSQALQRLRDIGVSIALDDFGTGYSSLSYLGRLPVDKIKIDQSFVKCLPADQEAGAIIRAVMTLSETLDKLVIAEGIETADQAWMLRMMGCRVGQGYHFGRPKSAAEMRAAMTAPAVWPAPRFA